MPAHEQLITIDHTQVVLRKLTANDLDALLYYLHHLSDETKKRFGSHPFNRESIYNFYFQWEEMTGYVAEETGQSTIIAYSIIKNGCLAHDFERLNNYGLLLDNKACCTFAPSVADKWQSRGIGKSLFNFILNDLRAKGIKKIILWGGVQTGNEKAVNFYTKAGFKTLGVFEYNGFNLDMLLEMDNNQLLDL